MPKVGGSRPAGERTGSASTRPSNSKDTSLLPLSRLARPSSTVCRYVYCSYSNHTWRGLPALGVTYLLHWVVVACMAEGSSRCSSRNFAGGKSSIFFPSTSVVYVMLNSGSSSLGLRFFISQVLGGGFLWVSTPLGDGHTC